MIYNMPAVHPVTGEYYYNTILGYGWSFLTNDISVYDLGSGTPKMVADYRNYTLSRPGYSSLPDSEDTGRGSGFPVFFLNFS